MEILKSTGSVEKLVAVVGRRLCCNVSLFIITPLPPHQLIGLSIVLWVSDLFGVSLCSIDGNFVQHGMVGRTTIQQSQSAESCRPR